MHGRQKAIGMALAAGLAVAALHACSENPTGTNGPAPQPLDESISETVAIADSVILALGPGGLVVPLSEAVAISDSVVVDLGPAPLRLAVAESIAVSDSAAVTASNYAPTATIVAPPDSSSYLDGESISFEGSASDPEDGTLTGPALVWTSSLDGEIGTGTSFVATLSVGTHAVSLTATDSEGASDTETVTVEVQEAGGDLGGILVNVAPDGVDVTNDQIFRITPDGSEVVALTGDDPNDPEDGFYAVGWSPDGRDILYSDVSDRESGPGDLYRMNRDGSGKVPLTDSPYEREGDPTWSPAGPRIAFWKNLSTDGDAEIYVMNADGTGLQWLTDNDLRDTHPSWSPDGTRIVFTQRGHNGERYVDHLVVMDADGANAVQLTTGASSNTTPVWAPAGGRIAFISDRDGVYNSCAVYVMNPDGSGLLRLTDPTPAQCGSLGEQLTWSPDGTRLALLRTPDGDPLTPAEIWVVHADGSTAYNATSNGPARDYHPAWSPDGTRIVFGSDRSGDHELYVMNADGSSVTWLADPGATERPVAWK